MHDNFLELKNKYKDGYRCIHQKEGTYTLRDFNKGKICTVSTNDRMEVGEIDDFLRSEERRVGKEC